MTSTHCKMFDNNVTIMKYLSADGEYKFKVLDKFNEPDEVERLLKMINISNGLRKSGELKKQLWIKTVPTI